MTKRVSGRLVYDADPATVYTMYLDPAFVQEKNERTGGNNVSVKVTKKGKGSEIVVSRSLPAQLPAFAKKLIGETIDTIQTDVWQAPNDDASRDGTIEITFGGAPIAAEGTFRLEVLGKGSVCIVEINVKVSVPFIGGKVESVAGEQVIRAINAEESIGQEWLAGRT